MSEYHQILAVLALVSAIIWIVTHTEIPEHPTKMPRGTPVPTHVTNVKKAVPTRLAKRKSRLVKCGVGKPCVPIYKRTPELYVRAQELVEAVAMGKQAIAAHMDAKRQGVQTDESKLRTIIAGVVRDRKTLKKLQYDQPF